MSWNREARRSWLGALVLLLSVLAGRAASVDYAAVDAVFSEHCLDCHAAKDPEGQLVLETFDMLMKGGESGPAIVASNSTASLLVRLIEGKIQKEGKPKLMPPGKRKKLNAAEIATIKSWIDAGAPAPAVASRKPLVIPKIAVRGTPRNPINALAYSAAAKRLALARYAGVEVLDENFEVTRTLAGPQGNVNAVAFSADGEELFAAGGQPGVAGEIRQWRVKSGEPVRTFEGHQDAVYGLALSPDGKLMATGGYDQKIKLWNLESGKEARTLSGHNGCVYELAFRPDGKILASASADRTVKLWDVASGERRDTLSQSSKELFSLAFSPDGRRLAAGGADNRIRVWEISQAATETSNHLLHSKFGHEGAILRLVFSRDGEWLLSAADDKSVKLWDPASMKERLLLEPQPDWPPGLAFVGGQAAVGRADGSLVRYDLQTGKPIGSAKLNNSAATATLRAGGR